MKRLILIALAISFSVVSLAQNFSSIKKDPRLVYAEAEALTSSAADSIAVEALASRLAALVALPYSPEVNAEILRGYLDEVKTASKILLVTDKKSSSVIRYIATDDIEKVFVDRRRKVNEMLSIATNSEQKRQIDVALRYYEWAEVLLKSLPPVDQKLIDQTIAKRQDILSRMVVSFERKNRSGKSIADISFKYKGLPVASVDYRFFDGSSWSEALSAKDGVGTIEVNPSSNPDTWRIAYETIPSRARHIFREVAQVNNALGVAEGEQRAAAEARQPQGAPLRAAASHAAATSRTSASTTSAATTTPQAGAAALAAAAPSSSRVPMDQKVDNDSVKQKATPITAEPLSDKYYETVHKVLDSLSSAVAIDTVAVNLLAGDSLSDDSKAVSSESVDGSSSVSANESASCSSSASADGSSNLSSGVIAQPKTVLKPTGFALMTVGTDLDFGAMVAYMKRAGAYLHCSTNFRKSPAYTYECMSDGTASYGTVWTTGATRKAYFNVTAGPTVVATSWLAGYAGLGYGSRRLFWEDISNEWELVSDKSFRGLAAEAGVIVSYRHISATAGLSTIRFKTLTATFGLGYQF